MIDWGRRLILFIIVNFFVVVSITIILNLLGVQPYLTDQGINPTTLAVFCVIWGSVGSFISLMLSKTMAMKSGNVQLIDPNTSDPHEKEVLAMVYGLARKTGLEKMPDVGLYDSPELNAFATGPSKTNSLVAISTGLLQKMDKDEVAAVVGHEVSHVNNGDMVTMTLLQGIVNAFVMFFARIIVFALMNRQGNGDSRGGMMGSYGLIQIIQTVLMFLGMIVVAAFSRWRELRADVGGARLAGRQNMINALKVLKANINIQDKELAQQASFQSLKISLPSGVTSLFATHPPIEQRIERLQQMVEIK